MRGVAGLVFRSGHRPTAEHAMDRLAKRVGAGSAEGLLERVREDTALRETLVAELTVGESYFFRDPGQFAVIRRRVLPSLRHRRPLRVWSAGCAAGEEPYSLAIVAAEEGLADRVRVLGTDISQERLAAARVGRYRQWAFRGVPESMMERRFRPVPGGFELEPAIRGLVEFRYLNLAEDRYPSAAVGVRAMDLILCRNVLIYFDRETVGEVIRRLFRCLSPEGWLLMGASDPSPRDFVECDVVVTEAGLAYRRPGVEEGRDDPGPAPAAAAGEAPEPPPPAAPTPGSAAPPAPTAPAAPRSGTARPGSPPPPPRASLPSSGEDAPADPDDAALESARRAYANGRYEEAIRALAPCPSDVLGGAPREAVCVLRVRALANLGRSDEAMAALRPALEAFRTSSELWYLRATLLGEQGRDAEAAEAARRAVFLDRKLVVAHLALGHALARLERRREAAGAYRNAEALLEGRDPAAVVPASDGATVRRLRELARVQARLQEASP